MFEAKVDDTEQAYEVDENTDIVSLCKKISFPVMVKPCDGSGSRGAKRVDKSEDFFEACNVAMNASITHRAEVETFIVGREYGAESLVADGKVNVLAIMQKQMTVHPYYAELGHSIPSKLSVEIKNKAKNCVENAIKALGINFGSVNMDMLITDESKVHIIDIGARMGGNMIGPCIVPYGTGIDYVADMIRNAVGDKVYLKAEEHGAVATRLLAFDKNISVKQLPDFEAIENKYGVEIYHHMNVGDEIHEYHTNLDGMGYIVARDKDVNKATDNVEKALETVREFLSKE